MNFIVFTHWRSFKLIFYFAQAQTPAHYANVNMSNIAMRNAALFAALAQQQQQQVSHNL